jgi:hypothetical protein
MPKKIALTKAGAGRIATAKFDYEARMEFRRLQRKGQVPERLCRECEKQFIPVRWWQLFCSSKCRSAKFVEEAERPLMELRAENELLKRQLREKK